MPKVIKVGLTFEFYPEGEHAEMFEDIADEETLIRFVKNLAFTDIINATNTELFNSLEVKVEKT
jgi:hypothetical protein